MLTKAAFLISNYFALLSNKLNTAEALNKDQTMKVMKFLKIHCKFENLKLCPI